ncbi:MAG: class I SAM-dependent methyltransferase [Acidobacteria bacterium]|nr:MAG: class I SAM-dependent methyltransferase [Acidobacteriota bacterium]REK08881.1 MAG: class I SAM-dependent methyltransferase [Acidobacteriota bacterium]
MTPRLQPAETTRPLCLATALALALALTSLLLAPSLLAQSGEERTYAGREIAGVMSFHGASWLERDSRIEEEDPAALLALLPLEPGDTAVDMGCGSGYHARRMASKVGPEGRVLCVDIQPEMLEIARRLAESEGIANIDYVLGAVDDPKLAPASVDLILLVDVYHEFARPEPMLAAMRRALRHDGVAALVEYRLEGESAAWIRPEHRMSIEQVKKEWLPAGFELRRLVTSLPSQHLFLFAPGEQEP